MLFERAGWGRGLVDAAPPIIEGAAQAGALRQLVWRLSCEAMAIPELSVALVPTFAAGLRTRHAELARAMSLIVLLLRKELPAVRRTIRCQALRVLERANAPSAGRLDPIRTLREAPPGPPAYWHIMRTTLHSDSPVDRLVATRLSQARARLEDLSELELLVGEQRLLSVARRALARTLTLPPLSYVSVAERAIEVSALIREARRFPAELRRVGSFLQWYEALDQVDLRLLSNASDESALDVHASFEAAVGFALMVGLARRATSIGPLRFRDGPTGQELALILEATPEDAVAPATLRVRTHGDRDLVVVVRNAAGRALRQLGHWLALDSTLDADMRTVLIAPAPAVDGTPVSAVFLDVSRLQVDPIGTADELWDHILGGVE